MTKTNNYNQLIFCQVTTQIVSALLSAFIDLFIYLFSAHSAVFFQMQIQLSQGEKLLYQTSSKVSALEKIIFYK